jgi:hypothetical protein
VKIEKEELYSLLNASGLLWKESPQFMNELFTIHIHGQERDIELVGTDLDE